MLFRSDDPELFATYSVLTGESVTTVIEHLTELTDQLTRVVRDGVDAGTFTVADPGVAALAVFQATGRYHDPVYAQEWEQPGAEEEFTALVDLLVRGLRA